MKTFSLGTVLSILLILIAGACQSVPARGSVNPLADRAASHAPVTAVPSREPGILATATVPHPMPSPSSTPTTVPSPTPTAIPSSPIPSATSVVRATVLPTPPPRDLADLARRLTRRAVLTPAATPRSAPDYPVGTEHTFWVADQEAKTYFQMRARIVVKTPHAYWYLQDGLQLPVTDVQAAADYFETRTYPTEHRWFGSEWTPGIDRDPHITILIGRIPEVGGYFSSADEYTRAINPYSNEREMIYINADAVRPGTATFNTTVAHEFMHMIQFHVHRWQDSWVDEGSAELAAQAVTGATSGAVRAFTAMPDTQLDAWASDPTEAIPHYGAAYLFMRYVAEQYGGFAAIGKIIAEPARGIDSFEQFFHTMNPPRSFEDVFADWVAANALDDPTLDSGRYGYHSLHLAITVHDGPPVGGQVTGQVHQFGATYYRIQVDRPATLIFTGARDGQLIGADPHGAPWEWWSNRGDSIDSRLTRTVDLRGVSGAQLSFWAWYDIEKDFDYAYIEVSTDGGQTWQTIPTGDTTRSNPNGQNYGDGLTGESGGAAPRWVHEEADLTPYAGKEVLLRFEYVTDDSYNGDGLALDDIEIPEIGFHDTVQSDNGWIAEGFVRIDNQWRQPYLVEALSPSTSPPVRRLPLDANQQARLVLQPGKPIILAIAGLAPVTTHPAPYRIAITPNQ
ncbi:MAG: immune inhibitor A [Chloroflexi bacterium]|nr:immune inhibitor A [Chloroflexota bacterium]